MPDYDAEVLKGVRGEFRSDTFTMQNAEMFAVMEQASRGDDVYDGDDATTQLQKRVAEMTGKEAGLFCVSGTLSNQLAIRTHLHQPPFSVLCDYRAHVYRYEAGGIAYHSQAQPIPVAPKNGHHLTLEDDIIPNVIESDDIHFAPTRLICLENTCQGMIFPQDEILRISEWCHSRGIALHCDGARIWETAAATGKSLRELCAPFDTVSLCMSKGLGAPVGTVLVGPAAFIRKAKHFRKLFGGGIRQSGMLCAAANYCIDNVFPNLPKAHSLAKELATRMAKLGARVVVPVETNMVFLATEPLGFTLVELKAKAGALAEPLRTVPGGPAGGRFVLHHQLDPASIDSLVRLASEMKTTDVPSDEHSLINAEGRVASVQELIDATRPGATRAPHRPGAAQAQDGPYR